MFSVKKFMRMLKTFPQHEYDERTAMCFKCGNIDPY